MFERLIQFAIEQRIIVLLAVLLMAGLGVASEWRGAGAGPNQALALRSGAQRRALSGRSC